MAGETEKYCESPKASASDPCRRLSPWIVVAGCALALLCRLPGLREPLWRDEVLSAWVADRPPVAVPGLMAAVDLHPPMYFTLLSVWIKLFGREDYVLRLLSVAIGLGTVLVSYRLALRWYGRRAAWVVLLLTATAPGLCYISQEVRNQILLALTATLALSALGRWAEGQRPHWLFLYGLAGGACLYTNYHGLALLASLAAASIAFLGPRLTILRWEWLAAHLLIAVLFLPWLGVFLTQEAEMRSFLASYAGTPRGGTGLISAASLLAGADPLRSVRVVLRTTLSGRLSDLLAAALGLLLVIVVARWKKFETGRTVGVLPAVAAIGAALILGVAHEVRGTLTNARYFPMFSPLLLLPTGWVLSRWHSRWQWSAIIGVLALQVVAAIPSVRRAPIPWRQVTAYLETHRHTNPAIVLSLYYYGGKALRLYGYKGSAVDLPYELEGVEWQRRRIIHAQFLQPRDAPLLDRLLQGQQRFWLLTSASEKEVSYNGDPTIQHYVRSRGWRVTEKQVFGDAELRLLERPGPTTPPG